MSEKPRRRDESIIRKKMSVQIGVMGVWLTVLSFIYLFDPFNIFAQLFKLTDYEVAAGVTNVIGGAQHLTGYFVLFIVSALFNGFNVRDDGFGIFKGLNENTGFIKVFIAIVLVQAVIVNAGLVPFLGWISRMFSCEPFGIAGWGVVILLAMTMIPVDLVRKVITNAVSK